MRRPRQQTIRFAVGAPDGPRSSIWRLWVPTDKSDVYVAARSLADKVKVSLHKTGQWRFSLTNEYWDKRRRADRLDIPKPRPYEWTRPHELSPGLTLAFRVIVPSSSVTLPATDPATLPEVKWVSPPPEGFIVEFQVWLASAGAVSSTWPGHRSRGTELIGKAVLANGESAWVTALQEPEPASVSDQIARWREMWSQDLSATLGQASEPNIRSLLFGTEEDGSGCLIDIDLPRADSPVADTEP